MISLILSLVIYKFTDDFQAPKHFYVKNFRFKNKNLNYKIFVILSLITSGFWIYIIANILIDYIEVKTKINYNIFYYLFIIIII